MESTPGGPPGRSLAARVRAGETSAVARAVTIVERGGASAEALLEALASGERQALLIGVTGPPGAGKSTLVGRLVAGFRALEHRVAVLAVDPSSPFSGGALLGDRIRMQAHALDGGVFIRSMATRGHLGGLPAAAGDAADVLDAAGFGVVIVETVGVGQDEVDIARLADVAVVVMVPGAGDEIQAMKAGLMEIADLFVINKADLPGADRAAAAIEQNLDLAERHDSGRPPVLQVSATTGEGIDRLVEALERRRAESGLLARRRTARAGQALVAAMAREMVERVRTRLPEGEWDRCVAALAERRTSAPRMARELADVVTTGAIDHVGIATDDLQATLALFAEQLALKAGESEDVASQGVRVRFLGHGDARLEVIEALDPESPFAKSLARRGPGLHHVALRVPDVSAALARLDAAGVRLIDRAPRPGAHGTRVAFIHPASARGVLVELVERRRDGDGDGDGREDR